MFKNLIAKLKCNRGEVTTTPEGTPTPPASNTTEPEKFSIKVNGEEKQLTKEEIVELAQKGQDYTNKTMALSEDRKSVKERESQLDNLVKLNEEIEANPQLKEGITKMIDDVRAGKPLTQKKVEKNLKTIDKYLDAAKTAEEREQLTDLQNIVAEAVSSSNTSGVTKEEFDAMKAEVEAFKKSASVGLSGQIEGEIKKLEDKYGKELVEKYGKDIRASARQYPSYIENNRFSKILFAVASDNEIEDALLKSAQQRKELEKKRKEDGTFPGGPSTPSKVDIPRDKAGRVDKDQFIKNLQAAGKL